MSTRLPTRPPKFESVHTPRFAIVASEYNPELVQGLINNTCKELYNIEERSSIELFSAPGSFEIPVVVEMVAALRKHDVIIALGVLLQGETKHAELVAQSVAGALQQVALKHTVPVIHEVLLVGNEEEARARCLGKELNRGLEAARAAFAMHRVRHQLRDAVPGRPAK
ncbi:MAG: 6,7-dimethyl-8-ribityllumazine synthase [Chthoniobacterales bacterium]|jgi:6,7-dimethyl-8-ribityllumazine synthase|nr:6,7-dimethyl-8-ribityllumazine synthase [Chthoniobacterales bacterium]